MGRRPILARKESVRALRVRGPAMTFFLSGSVEGSMVTPREPRLPGTGLLIALALAGCSAPPRSGPAADASAALARGDQRVLSLISLTPDAQDVWLPLGLDCYPIRIPPQHRVGRRIEDHDTYKGYVVAYNQALVADRRYRFAKYCKPLNSSSAAPARARPGS
jgi:hypothetical protein